MTGLYLWTSYMTIFMRAHVTRRWTSYKGQPVIPVICTRGHSGTGDATGAIPTDRRLCASRSRAQTSRSSDRPACRAGGPPVHRRAAGGGYRAPGADRAGLLVFWRAARPPVRSSIWSSASEPTPERIPMPTITSATAKRGDARVRGELARADGRGGHVGRAGTSWCCACK